MTARRSALALAVCLATLLTATTAAAAPTAPGGPTGSASATTASGGSGVDVVRSDNASHDAVADAPPDPESDVLGWERGVWYNESIRVTPTDGYNRTEIERIVARSSARVERIRGLEFEATPNVTLITREEFRAFTEDLYGNVTNTTTERRLHQNTKFEALFLVGEDDSYFADFVANQGSIASAFHVNEDIPEHGFEEGDIGVVVSDSGRATELSEPTLGHELLHFVQNNRFDVSRFSGGPTEEAARVNTSLVEADATWVGQTYGDRCGVSWNCLPTSGATPPTFENFGLVLYSFGPYSNTATLFEQQYRANGVEGLNALYERPPASTEQFLHPEDYPDDEPVDVRYEDRSGDAWRLQTFEDGTNYATFGEMGIFVMLYYPSYQTRSTVAIDYDHPFQGSQTNTYVRLDFVHPASTGWDGDKLFVYTNDGSAATNETGYVWKTVWESPAEAEEFADAYTAVLREYGDAVADRRNTYRIPEESAFGDAFYVAVDGDTVTVVNAPTVGDLSEVRSGAAPEVERTTTATTTEPADDGTTTAPPDDDTTTTPGSESQPGFGIALAVVAVLAALLVLRRRS